MTMTVHVTVSCQMHSHVESAGCHVGCTVMLNLRSVMSDLRSVISDAQEP